MPAPVACEIDSRPKNNPELCGPWTPPNRERAHATHRRLTLCPHLLPVVHRLTFRKWQAFSVDVAAHVATAGLLAVNGGVAAMHGVRRAAYGGARRCTLHFARSLFSFAFFSKRNKKSMRMRITITINYK